MGTTVHRLGMAGAVALAWMLAPAHAQELGSIILAQAGGGSVPGGGTTGGTGAAGTPTPGTAGSLGTPGTLGTPGVPGTLGTPGAPLGDARILSD